MHRLEGHEIAKVSQTDQKEKSLPSWSLCSQRRRQLITKQIHKIYRVLVTKILQGRKSRMRRAFWTKSPGRSSSRCHENQG